MPYEGPPGWVPADCKPVDDYPSPDATMQNVAVLYYNDTFKLLERYLSGLDASEKRFSDGQFPREVLSAALMRLMSMGGATHQEADQRLAAWRKAAPDSRFITYVEAARLHALAWEARGRGYADSVSPESWEIFSLRLQQAERVLLDAPPSLQESPMWHDILLAISLDSDRLQSKPHEVFARAVKRWPAYATFYESMAARLLPKWGGSWAQVESFIAASTAMQPASEGKSMYARLYIYLIPQRAMQESKMDREMVKAGFEDSIARFSHPKYKNLYASYACLAQDKGLFSEAMRNLGSDAPVKAWWLSGHSYDACMRWAGV